VSDALANAVAWARAQPELGPAISAAERAGLAPVAAAASIPFVRSEIVRPAAHRAWLDRAEDTRRAGAAIDLLLLGAGPTNAALCVALQRTRPDLSVVVVDRALPGGPFTRVGAAFRLNTWSAPGPTGMSLLDEVDIHAGLVVSPSTLSAARFPTGDTLGDATLLSWLSSSCGAIIDDVTTIAADEVSFTLGNGTLRAPAAVLATGFGLEPRYTFDATFVVEEAKRPLGERRVLDAEALFAHALAAGVAVFDGVELGVVGAGPTAIAVLAMACGLGPAELTDAPSRYSRWRARPRITWITGENGYVSARDARQAWEGGDERARPGAMGYVLAEGAATLLHELVFLEDIGRLTVVGGRVDSITHDGDRVVLAVGGQQLSVRRAVLCTGYAPRLVELLRLPGGRTAASLAELLASDVAKLVHAGDEPIAIALGRTHIIGAAIEEAVTPDASRPPFAEYAMRAAALAAQLARELPPGSQRAPLDPIVLRDGSANVTLHRTGDDTPRPWDRMLAPVDMLVALSPFSCEARALSFELADGELRCRGLDADAAARIASRLPDRLVACAGRRPLSVTIDVDASGSVVPASAR
jgi:hypothetical protein